MQPIKPQYIDFKDVFMHSLAANAIMDSKFTLIEVNDAYCALIDRHAEDLIGQTGHALFAGDDGREEQIVALFEKALDGQYSGPIEFYCPADDLACGTEDRWWRLDCVPLPPDVVHGPIFMLHLENATERVAVRERRDSYASELQHRIGNVLTLVQIIARRTIQTSDDLDSFASAFENRIKGLGKTHAFLSGAHWDGMTVRQIIEQQIKTNGLEGSDAIEIVGPPWRLSVLHAQTFAMAMQELISNAADHGALSIPGGRVRISWDNPKDDSYSFIWKEYGLSHLVAPEKHGFGLQMIDRLLPGQLGGKSVMAWTPEGFHYILIVPTHMSVILK